LTKKAPCAPRHHETLLQLDRYAAIVAAHEQSHIFRISNKRHELIAVYGCWRQHPHESPPFAYDSRADTDRQPSTPVLLSHVLVAEAVMELNGCRSVEWLL
jgi:hypothetical protein